MMDKKVIYNFGDNSKFDYILIDTKENAIEKEISRESLVFKLCGETKVKMSKYGNLPFGNKDYVLEKRDKKTDEFGGLILVDAEDITELE